MRNSKIAKFGRSKEKRNDCKLLVPGLVINAEGFPKHYALFEGNMSDPKSLIHIIEGLEHKPDGKKDHPQTIVMDAGIASEENLELLRELQYNYICVSRKRLTGHEPTDAPRPVIVRDRLDQPIELLSVDPAGDNGGDRFVQVRSRMKALKEGGMKQQAASRYEQELTKIRASLTKKGGTKQEEKVNRRIGRAQQKYPSAQSNYVVELKCRDNMATDLVWNSDPFTTRVTAPHWHIHIWAILAYWLVITIRHQLKGKGIWSGWKHILEVMDSHKLVTSTMKTSENEEVEIIRCSESAEKVREIYQAVKITEVPCKPKKSVRYQLSFQKKSNIDYQTFNSS